MRRGWWLVVPLLVGAPGCSSSSAPHYCQSDANCGTGQVCGTEDCGGINTCIRAECACIPPNGFRNPCSDTYSKDCSCDAATCGHPLDTCGHLCPGVCNTGDSCQFCTDGKTCDGVEPCLGSSCIIDPDGKAVCRPFDCIFTSVQPPLCGSPDAVCGPTCPKPDCSTRECGDDPSTGLSCGSCGVHHYCDIDGKCVEPPEYLLCNGDLTALSPEIAVDIGRPPMPAPVGGTITDGIYDLVAEHEYQTTIPISYVRSAMRFSEGGTHVEHIYDADFSSGADQDSPHRLMNVSAAGTELSFDVTCPTQYVFFPHYVEGFTVNGDELDLFQPYFIEVYMKRH